MVDMCCLAVCIGIKLKTATSLFNNLGKMVLLDNDGFLLGLTKMFQSNKSSGSVNITLKKYDGRTTRTKPQQPLENLCLIRASDNKTKLSTVISSKEVTKFQMSYATLLRGNMDSLKKHDKHKERKGRKRKDL